MKLKQLLYAFLLLLSIGQASFVQASAAADAAAPAQDSATNDAKANAKIDLEQVKKKIMQAKLNEQVIIDLKKVLGSQDDLIKINFLRVLNGEPVNIDQKFGDDQNTLLTAAVCLDNSSLVGLILKNKPTINQQNRTGETALHYAALLGVNPNITQALLDAGAALDIRNDLGETPLIMGARYKWWFHADQANYTTTLKVIIVATNAKDKNLINALEKQNINALVVAIVNYNFLAVHLLLTHNANRNQLCKGFPAIVHAMAVKQNGNPFLIDEQRFSASQRKASIEAILRDLNTPSVVQPPNTTHALASAAAGSAAAGVTINRINVQPSAAADAKQKKEEVEEPYIHIYTQHQLRDLIQSGELEVNAPLDPERNNRTVLCWAAVKNDLKLAVLAVANGFTNFFAQDSDGENALTLAAHFADANFVRFLLTFMPADVCNRAGDSAILVAVQSRKLESIRALAAHIHPDNKLLLFNKPNKHNMTPLIDSFYMNVPEITAELLRNGANPIDQGQLSDTGQPIAPLAIARIVYNENEIEVVEGQSDQEIYDNNQNIIQMLVNASARLQSTAQLKIESEAKAAHDAKRKNKRKEKEKASRPKLTFQPKGKAKPASPDLKQKNEKAAGAAAGAAQLDAKKVHEAKMPPAQQQPATATGAAAASSQPTKKSSKADLLEHQLALHEEYKLEFDRIIKDGTKEEATAMMLNYKNLLAELKKLGYPAREWSKIHGNYFRPLHKKAMQK